MEIAAGLYSSRPGKQETQEVSITRANVLFDHSSGRWSLFLLIALAICQKLDREALILGK